MVCRRDRLAAFLSSDFPPTASSDHALRSRGRIYCLLQHLRGKTVLPSSRLQLCVTLAVPVLPRAMGPVWRRWCFSLRVPRFTARHGGPHVL